MDNHDAVNLIKLFVFNTILDVDIHEREREPMGPQLIWLCHCFGDGEHYEFEKTMWQII